ncbi:MAG: alpha/beta fold hydrolase [Chloroflexi bacterium]|nr:alpha/beta fold hydrolase [Chloroflexota bacterium]
MRIQSDTDLITFQDWTLRVRPAAAGVPRLMLLIHGWTGDENSMWVFARSLPRDFWMIAPRAPYATERGGYSWRPPRAENVRRTPNDSRGWPGFDDFRHAADSLIRLVDAYAAQNGMDVKQFDVMGFSQGAALTNTIALLYPERIRRAGVLAGFIPAGAESVIEKRPLNGKPIFVAHGTLDEMVSIEYARQSVEMLERAGASVTFCEDEVGHKVSANCMRGLEQFFA